MTPCGSSPLARGLHARLHVDRAVHRIIPARAGFTPQAPTTPRSPTDHPRSRGVYVATPVHFTAGFGSSPLARGLPEERGLEARDGGIIPARAGFTLSMPRRTPRRPDHPRSRGVYPASQAVIMKNCGSSPLARGLPMFRSAAFLQARIIPARAGFTRATST